MTKTSTPKSQTNKLKKNPVEGVLRLDEAMQKHAFFKPEKEKLLEKRDGAGKAKEAQEGVHQAPDLNHVGVTIVR